MTPTADEDRRRGDEASDVEEDVDDAVEDVVEELRPSRSLWHGLISLVILVRAEFNAMLFPRAFLGKELTEMPAPQTATK